MTQDEKIERLEKALSMLIDETNNKLEMLGRIVYDLANVCERDLGELRSSVEALEDVGARVEQNEEFIKERAMQQVTEQIQRNLNNDKG